MAVRPQEPEQLLVQLHVLAVGVHDLLKLQAERGAKRLSTSNGEAAPYASPTLWWTVQLS